MKRRNLLGLLSVIPFAGPALSSTAEPADEWESDVCVIGAGLAGLTAAIAAKRGAMRRKPRGQPTFACSRKNRSLKATRRFRPDTSARCAICRGTTRSTARQSTP